MILNVDDHEPGRYARSRLLKQAGFEVTEAETGTQALELAEALRPALIMLDVNLPDISGLEVCRKIKSNSLLGSTPVLQISASAVSTEDRVDGLDNGADAYLVEPVHSDVLLATVRALLRMRKAEAASAEANLALQEANSLLRRTNEDLQNFAHAASHDLKEPLRSISCFAGLLEKKYRGHFDSDGEAMLTNIQKGASRMSALIEGLLHYAQAGQLTQEDWEDVDLSRVVAGAIRNLEESIKESGAMVACDPLPIVRGNEASLSQVFQNLIHNGLKYHKPNEPSSIAISAATKTPGMVEIAIADDGMGIPLQHQNLIFAPFQRLHGSEVPGFGIGLATCRRIVERHGGQIWVKSDGPGKGATFYLSLPLR
jgi:two-component system sensor histidine kinase/response regulator